MQSNVSDANERNGDEHGHNGNGDEHSHNGNGDEHGHDHSHEHNGDDHSHDHHDHDHNHDHGHHHGHSHGSGGLGIRSRIAAEVMAHAPFTIGAVLSVTLVIGIASLYRETAWTNNFFESAHWLHIFVSAVASSAVAFRNLWNDSNDRQLRNIAGAMGIGVVFSILFCSISDSLVPQMGLKLFGIEAAHEHAGHAHGVHLDILENPIQVLFVAVVGSFLGIARLGGKASFIAHALHSIASSAASLLFLLSGMGVTWFTWANAPAVMAVLFLSVMVVCVLSDVIMPVGSVLTALRLKSRSELR